MKHPGFSSSPHLRHTRRPRTTAAERAVWIARYEESGLSAARFARRACIPYPTFFGWLQQHRLQVRRPRPSLPMFQTIPLTPPPGVPAWVAEVQRPDGLLLRLAAGAPQEVLVPLLALCASGDSGVAAR